MFDTTSLRNNNLCEIYNEIKTHYIMEKFNSEIKIEEISSWHLTLTKFCTESPFMYFNFNTFKKALMIFEENKDSTNNKVAEMHAQLTHAIFSSFRKGSSWDDEDITKIDNPRDIMKFESVWHPEYIRYSEHILNHLVSFLLAVLSDKNDLKVSSYLSRNVNMLKEIGYPDLILGYVSTIRNAISHGQVSYNLIDIKYVDRSGELTLSPYGFQKEFDLLVDTCNAILCALFLYISKNREIFIKQNIAVMPMGLIFVLVQSMTSHDSFNVVQMVESRIGSDKTQLNISCRVNSKSRVYQMYECLCVATKIIDITGNRYNRLGFSIDCDGKINPSLFVNTSELREILKQDKVPEENVNRVVDAALLWYDSSKLFSKIDNYKRVSSAVWKLQKIKFSKNMQSKDLLSPGRKILIKNKLENRSTEKLRRVFAHVVITHSGTYNNDDLSKIVVCGIKKVRKKNIKLEKLNGEPKFKGKPKYVWIKLYAGNKRIRTLKNSYWDDELLILEAEWMAFMYRKKPILVKDPDFVANKVRIRINPRILENHH